MSKKLAAKALLVQLPPVCDPPGHGAAPAPAPSPAALTEPSITRVDRPPHEAGQVNAPMGQVPGRPKTAPGSMAMFLATQSAAMQEAEQLKVKLQAFDGAVPMRSLDPRRIRASRWANRHPDSFADNAFEELRGEIAATGTNVQPICVRALPSGADPEADYELVFGHRRHRACLELGLPVQTVIAEVDDKALFEAMERENRGRKNLSAWEQGMMYRRALDSGLYPSQRKLAEALSVDLSLVSKSLALARLPQAVLEAFSSPLEVQFRWAQPLGEALQRDPEGLVRRAKSLQPQKGRLSGRQVFEHLMGKAGEGVLNGSTPSAQPTAPAKVQVSRDAQGRALVRFEPGVLTAEREAALMKWIEAHVFGERAPDSNAS
ncbi:Chromosome-partitioning protein Spo0J [Xylophilus ampelinus]|nr:Chromosome-partitioning protein Spo0J [Xylophilus ampelinus]